MAVEQKTQVRSSIVFDDTLSLGAALETLESLEDDLNALRSKINKLHGKSNWYDDVNSSFGLEQIRTKLFAVQVPARKSGSNQSKYTSGNFVGAVDASMFEGGSGVIAVGPNSVAEGGYIAANEPNFITAGSPSQGLSTVQDADGNILNAVILIDADTFNVIEDQQGMQVFGLLQCLNGTADGSAIAAAGSENLQITPVRFNNDTGVLETDVLSADHLTLFFAPRRLRRFETLKRGAFINEGGSPDVIGQAFGARLNVRVFELTDVVNADDPMNINTGIFDTAGDVTSQLYFSGGDEILPEFNTEFRNDDRITIYRNGIYQIKWHTSNSDAGELYYVDQNKIAFRDSLAVGDVIYIETPGSY